jgi:hypothetical protein
MWSTWGAVVLIYVVLHLYRSRLTRDEEDQIFLDDSFSHEQTAQAAIIAKVNKIEPLVRGSLWLVGAASLFVVVYYVMDIVKQFN